MLLKSINIRWSGKYRSLEKCTAAEYQEFKGKKDEWLLCSRLWSFILCVLTVKNSGVTCEVSSILKIVGIELSFRLILL